MAKRTYPWKVNPEATARHLEEARRRVPEYVREADGRVSYVRPVTVKAISEALGCHRDTAHKYLAHPDTCPMEMAIRLANLLRFEDIEHARTGKTRAARAQDPNTPGSGPWLEETEEIIRAASIFTALEKEARATALSHMRGLLEKQSGEGLNADAAAAEGRQRALAHLMSNAGAQKQGEALKGTSDGFDILAAEIVVPYLGRLLRA